MYQYTLKWDEVTQEIKKGDRFLCTNDVVMLDDDSIAYKQGRTYVSDKDGHITNEQGQKNHEWRNHPDEDNWWDFFKKIPHPVEKCDCDKCEEVKDKDYFQSTQEEYGSGGETFTKRVQIIETFNSLCNLLQYKNHLYGDSGLTPINVFSKVNAETGLLQRLDDKIARVKNSPELRKNDVADIIGYLVLICVNKGWTNFDEFKD